MPGRVENDIIEMATVRKRTSGELHRGTGMPPRVEHFQRIGIDIRDPRRLPPERRSNSARRGVRGGWCGCAGRGQ
ncbi:MAG: hypothetical protein ACR2JU_10580 [Nocardioidaceae bacterium]